MNHCTNYIYYSVIAAVDEIDSDMNHLPLTPNQNCKELDPSSSNTELIMPTPGWSSSKKKIVSSPVTKIKFDMNTTGGGRNDSTQFDSDYEVISASQSELNSPHSPSSISLTQYSKNISRIPSPSPAVVAKDDVEGENN